MARRFRLLNDFEALALSLPHLTGDDVVQIGGETPSKPAVKIVLGPGTGLGMATLAPAAAGRLDGAARRGRPHHAAGGDAGRIRLAREDVEARRALRIRGRHHRRRTVAACTGPSPSTPTLATPEAVLQAALAGSDAAAVKTLDQFITWLARIAGDAAMTMQARGGVYLAGGIAPSIVDRLKTGNFRAIFQEKGRLAHVMRPIPVYVIVDRFPAFKGCAAAIAEER